MTTTNLTDIKNNIQNELQGKKLVRPREGRMIAGVCAGIANYLKVDPAIVRLATVVLAVFTAGTAALIYAAGWILMPEEETYDITSAT
ncbi:PspC domain-containing protein [Flindersiella endophytica]